MLDAENPAENPDATPAAEAGSYDGGGAGEDVTAAPAADAPAEEAPAEEAPAEEAGAQEAPAEAARRTAAKRTAAKKTTAKKVATKKTTAKRATKKAAPASVEAPEEVPAGVHAEPPGEERPETPAETPAARGEAAAEGAEAAPVAKKTAKRAAKKAPAKRAAKKAVSAEETAEAAEQLPFEQTPASQEAPAGPGEPETGGEQQQALEQPTGPVSATALLFQPPDPTKAVVTRRRRATRPAAPAAAEGETGLPTEAPEGEERSKPTKGRSEKGGQPAESEQPSEQPSEELSEEAATSEGEEEQGGERRRRRRGGRRRRRGGGEDNGSAEGAEANGGAAQEAAEQAGESEEAEEAASGGSRRRRRRRRSGEPGEGNGEEAEPSASRARKPRNAEDEITAVTGSTRLEAKKQRRREGREAGRRRAPIVSEAEFLARRESVDRVMVIRQRQDLTQIAVLEDKVLVEHYVSRESQTSLIGNVYLGRVQNVLPSMEAAFIDIGKGRNAVLYAGEVNWEALGAKNGSARKIEQVLKSGQTVLVQVTKDPIGHKGARLTSQISLPGRFLVYVPDGTTSGISRKLPDTERNRLKNLLKEIVPDSAGVIVRTAAEGASEEELTRDVERLRARWEDIETKVSSGNAPQLLYGEPDLTLKVVRDLFTEDFKKLVISGGEAWEMVDGYVSHVAPDLAERLERYDGERDVFAEYRIDEQIEKALDRKVWLPSGGSLVIDRTEAMTVVDVNTGKFTGSGGNLEETVTKNNLEAAEEIVRQLRLRDIGGIIVVDFIDMVLESNRDLVLRRLVECLGRDRTRHQVAEVTSLGLVQMTRKRIGTGLLEAFSESCEACGGRGLMLHHEPVEPKKKGDDESRRGRRGGRGRGREESSQGGIPSPKDIAAMARHEEQAGDEGRPEAKPASEPGEQEPREAAPAEVGAAEVATAQAATGTAQPAAAPAPDTDATPEGGADEPAEPRRSGGRGRGGRGRGGRRRPEGATEEPGTAEPSEEHGEAVTSEDSGSETSEQQERPEQAPLEPAPAQQAVGDATEVPAAQGAAELPGTGPHGAHGAQGAHGADVPAGEEQGAEASSAEPAAPPAPTVVTTVRRRSARRPAGPPSAGAEAASSSPQGPSGSVAVADPAGEDAVDEPADVDPLAALVDEAEEPPELDADGDLDGSDSDGSATPHVPIKKRGSRRR